MMSFFFHLKFHTFLPVVEVMIACIVLGTILILPTVLFWEFVMNEMEGKYRVPIPAPKNATVAPTTVVSTTTPAST